MQTDDIKQLSIDYLYKTPVGQELNSAIKAFEKIQTTLYNLATTDDSDDLLKIRVGTVLTLAVVNQLSIGKVPKDFTREDWKHIVNAIVEFGINVDDTLYSKLVFLTYADYIDQSVEVIKNIATKDKVEKIRMLSVELREKSNDLDESRISETKYIDECLWISLEAMLKLLVACTSKVLCPEIQEFLEGSASYAFEYGRLFLYQKENALLEEYLAHQNEMDSNLEQQYNEYLAEVQKQSEAFSAMLVSAFNDDFRTSLRGSAELARSVGVAEEEILDTVDKIDDFFA